MRLIRQTRSLPWHRPQPGPPHTWMRPYSLIYPKPVSANHHDLHSFLQYSERTGLDPKSTVYVGTHYEYTVAASLMAYGFSLQRVGGASDNGIDLLGTWTLPGSTAAGERPLRVLLQCKSVSRNPGPKTARELEGAFGLAPVGWRGEGVLGLLVAIEPATKGLRATLGRSQFPMAYVACSRAGRVQQMIWNHRAEREGLRDVGVSLRHSDKPGEEPSLVLTRNGQQLP